MAVDMPAAHRVAQRFVPGRFVIRVGSEWSLVRATAIFPIADVLDADVGLEPAVDGRGPAAEAAAERLVLDLVDSGMIAPPRPRRRRERPVSSRAVFYQAAGT
jgi:hypothetical protein